MRRTSACITTVLVAFGVVPRVGMASTPSVQSYQLEAAFIPAEARMVGRAVVTFDSTRLPEGDLTFYLHGELRVDSLWADSTSVPFEEKQVFYDYDYSLIADEVRLSRLPRPVKRLEILYSGYFHPSEARSPSDYMRIDSAGVFLRAYGYSLWFPVFLPSGADCEPVAFAAVDIRTPQDYLSVFAGAKTGEEVRDGQRITRWTALGVRPNEVQCTAQRYQVTSWGNYVLYNYTDSQSVAAAKTILSFATGLNAAYDRAYRHHSGAGQFYLLEMPEFGDISSGNVTGLTYWTWQKFNTDENAQRALAHELVHPYIAVPVARADSLYCLAVEGFPSYFHLPILAQSLGDDFYNRFLGWMQKLYLGIRATGVDNRGNRMPPEKPLVAITADELSTYKDEFVLSDRALLFLNCLYSRMGDVTFFKFTSALLNQPGITTPGFRRLVEQYLPGSGAGVSTWLATTDYPDRLHFEHFQRSSQR